MRHVRALVVAALCVAVALIVGTVLLGTLSEQAPVALAQAATGTPRSGIITIITVTPSVTAATTPAASATAPAAAPNRTPLPTASVAIPLVGTTITSTAPITGTFPVGAGSPGTITVVGEGRAKIRPDVAYVSIGVDVVKPTVRAASDEARSTMDTVLKALKAEGIADNDVQTAAFNIFVERERTEAGPGTTTPAEVVRYHVSNSVKVTVRDLTRVGNVLDAAIEAGANNIYGVNFAVEDPGKVQAQARELAVADARQRAADLARLNGVRVGPVQSISEVIGDQGVLSNNFRSAAVGQAVGGGSIEPGELELTMQLQITYAMQ